jgi:hypothetical protein
MTTFTKRNLSGSTNGKGIVISATSTLGNTIHTAVSGTSDWDEVWIYAFNSDSSSQDLTIEWGGVGYPDDNIICSIPALSGLQLIVPGLLIQNGLVISAFCSGTDVVTIHGFVNRIVN